MNLYLGSCFDFLPFQSVDMAFCDLPYGTTYADWDDPDFDLDRLWTLLGQAIRSDGAIVFTAQQPFTSKLVVSRREWFRCEWIWDKVNGTNFANANRQPLKTHENVLVFSREPTRYFPQRTQGAKNHAQGSKRAANRSATRLIHTRADDDLSGLKYPKTIQTFAKHSSQGGFHPTQKPVDLVRYFIETYTLPGETILDPTMGAGSIGVAAIESGRNFVGIEKDPQYFEIAQRRCVEARSKVLGEARP
jgi:site-specific DNA-methyltransferase (adenine-specific)